VVPPPFFRAALERGTRSQDGRPGPGYWQVYTEYDIDARLDPSSGSSPEPRRSASTIGPRRTSPLLQLLLNQNIHAEGVARNRAVEVTGGIRLGRVRGGRAGPPADLEPGRSGLPGPGGGDVGSPAPSREGGGVVELEVEWSFVVPQNGAGRMGHSQREMYFLAYWYPKVAVFDDLRGWDAESYRGAEFYHGYGDFRVSLTVPNGWIVMATGELENPGGGLLPPDPGPDGGGPGGRHHGPDRHQGRSGGGAGDGALSHRGPHVPVRGGERGGLHLDDVQRSAVDRDQRPGGGSPDGVPGRDGEGDGAGDRVAIHTFWREYRAPLWRDQALYAKHSIEYQSVYTGYPYPWPHMTSVEGADIIGGGMEFPMLTIMGTYQGRRPEDLYSVTAHEIGHMWVPMIVGTNEKRYAWMDEGLTSFLESETTPDYWPGITDPHGEWREGYLAVARMEQEQSMMRHADYYEPGPGYGNAAYQKPATLLVTLRNLLGEEVFREAYRGFIRDWAFKHPTPWDFFNTFARVAGQDLDWFWVAGTTRPGCWTTPWSRWCGRGRHGHHGGGPGVRLHAGPGHIRTDGGQTLEREIPVSHWLRGEVEAQIRIPSSAGAVIRVRSIRITTSRTWIRANNVWER
jgi:hypothetical protein